MIVAVAWRWQLLISIVGLALVAGPGLAATTLTCTPFEPEMVPGVRLRFPYEPFDPALGTLDEVTVTVQGRVFGQALINAPPGSPLPYHFTITHELSADLGRSFTFLGGARANFEFSGQSIPLVPFAYSREFAYLFTCGPSSNLDGFCPLNGTPGVDNVLTGMSASLDGFTDDGIATTYQVFVDTGFEPTGTEVPVGVPPDPLIGAEGDTCVEYIYTVPEPSRSLGFLTAALTLAALSRVRELRAAGQHAERH